MRSAPTPERSRSVGEFEVKLWLFRFTLTDETNTLPTDPVTENVADEFMVAGPPAGELSVVDTCSPADGVTSPFSGTLRVVTNPAGSVLEAPLSESLPTIVLPLVIVMTK